MNKKKSLRNHQLFPTKQSEKSRMEKRDNHLMLKREIDNILLYNRTQAQRIEKNENLLFDINDVCHSLAIELYKNTLPRNI